MFEKLKMPDFKTILKYFGFFILFIIFIAIAVGILGFIFNSINYNFLGGGRGEYGGSSIGGVPVSMDNSMRNNIGIMGEKNVNMQLSPESPQINESYYEVKTYNATLESSKVENDCKKLIGMINKEYVKTENTSLSKHHCHLTLKVLKGKEQDFINILNTFNVKDINSNTVNIVKSYTNLTDRITELQKRLSETDKLLTDSKTSYDELWNALKNKNTSAESIDSLNKIILNKSELVLKFSKEKESLIDQINNLIQQKDQYNEDLKYISFNVSFIEKVIIDMETLKDQWYYDYKTLVDTFNDTVRNLTINLISFLLKTLNVFIYAVLGIFFILVGGKLVYKAGRKIIINKEITKK